MTAVEQPTELPRWSIADVFESLSARTFSDAMEQSTADVERLVALFDDGFYAVRSDGLVVNVDYNTWGWVHLVIGVVGVLAGLGLLVGNMAARIVGIVVAFLSALVNLAFISAYPIWSTIMITIDVIVMYAIIVHGRELKRV